MLGVTFRGSGSEQLWRFCSVTTCSFSLCQNLQLALLKVATYYARVKVTPKYDTHPTFLISGAEVPLKQGKIAPNNKAKISGKEVRFSHADLVCLLS